VNELYSNPTKTNPVMNEKNLNAEKLYAEGSTQTTYGSLIGCDSISIYLVGNICRNTFH
jgi:hypothetical protein